MSIILQGIKLGIICSVILIVDYEAGWSERLKTKIEARRKRNGGNR